jgi:elongation factor G
MDFPEPVISMSIEPKTADDKRKLSEALVTIRREDPSFRSHYDDETGQTIIAGMGELHLEIIKNKLVRDMKIGVEVGKPRVSVPRGDHRKAENVRGKFVKQTGGRGQFGDCTINLEPFTAEQAEAEELKFKDKHRLREQDRRRLDPQGVHPLVEYGVRQTALKSGVTAGYPLINVKVDARRRLVPPGRLLAGRLRAGRPLALRRPPPRPAPCCSSRS